MANKEYDKELMEQYIELIYPSDFQETMTEEDKMQIANTLGFVCYSLKMELVQLGKALCEEMERFLK